jgi:Mg-chelatase subunit ChlD
MKLTIGDLRRAISNAGNTVAFAQLYQTVVGQCPIRSSPRLDLELPLPDPLLLIRELDAPLADFISGSAPVKSAPVPGDFDLTVISLPAYGKNLDSYLKTTLLNLHPDLLVLNVDPVNLAAETLYTFSLPCAVGYSFTSEIRGVDRQEIYNRRHFNPSGLYRHSIFEGWINRIPVLPLGKRPEAATLTYVPSQGYVDFEYTERAHWESEVAAAEQTLDHDLSGYTEGATPPFQPITRDLLKCASSAQREKLVDESCYLVSRLWEVIDFKKRTNPKPRVLIIADLAHYADIVYLCGLMKDGISDEIYGAAKAWPDFRKMIMDGVNQMYLENPELEHDGASEAFLSVFNDLVEKRYLEPLSDESVRNLAAQVAEKTRRHPQIERGISVRGTIAMLEVMRGLEMMRGHLTRAEVADAALICFPPRLKMRSEFPPTEVLQDILKEVFYGFSFEEDGAISAIRSINKISGGDILDKLNQMGKLPPEGRHLNNNIALPSIIPEDKSQQDLIKKLEQMQFLKKGQNGQFGLTPKALRAMMDQLEQRLAAREISPDEYQRQKEVLQTQMRKLSQPQFKMSSRDLANTIMELIDAQDRQWNKDINFQTLRTYYHIKENSEGVQIGDEKRDYYALQKLIDDLEKRKILAAATNTSGLLLTGLALDLLLKYFIEDERPARSSQSLTGRGKTLSAERSQEVRRFSSGDSFRDIALRPTLREIAHQKRSLKDIRASDLRVFLKQPRKPQSDIVICMDTSGSMGFHQKLMYSRLVAAGLIQAAFRERNRVGLVAFNDSGQIAIPLTATDKEALLNCIAGLNARGNTNIGEGIKTSCNMLFKNFTGNQKRIILVSDGQPTAMSESAFSKLKERREKDLTEESAILETRAAAGKGIQLSVIHIAGEGEANEQFVKNIVLAGKGKLRRISGPDDIKGLMK